MGSIDPWSAFVWVVGIGWTIINGALAWRVKTAVRDNDVTHDLKTLTVSVADMAEKVKGLDEAIRGNGKIGLCERVSVLTTEMKDHERRIAVIEAA